MVTITCKYIALLRLPASMSVLFLYMLQLLGFIVRECCLEFSRSNLSFGVCQSWCVGVCD